MVVRRQDKNGNSYYFNKNKGKRTSKRAWKISLSHRAKKPSYRTRKVDGRTVKVRLGKVRKGISYQKVSSLKKQRSKLYSQRSYWNDKLSKLIKKKAKQKTINDAKRKLSLITNRITKLNRKLGVVNIKKARPKKKRQYKENIITSYLPHWEGERELETALKENVIKKYIIDGVSYKKTDHLDIVLAYDEMVQAQLSIDPYPNVIFIYDVSQKILTVNIY